MPFHSGHCVDWGSRRVKSDFLYGAPSTAFMLVVHALQIFHYYYYQATLYRYVRGSRFTNISLLSLLSCTASSIVMLEVHALQIFHYYYYQATLCRYARGSRFTNI